MTDETSQSRSHWPIVILSSFSSLLGLLLPLFLVRILKPEEIGHFKIFFLYLTIIPAFSFSTGIMSGLAYWSGQVDRGRWPLKTSSALLLYIALVFGIVALLARHQVGQLFGWADWEPTLFAISLCGAVAASYFEEAAISTGKIWTGALFYSGFELVRTVAILVAVWYRPTLTSVLLAHTSVIMIKLVIGYLYGYRLDLVGFRISKRCVRPVWRYAFPVSLAWVFGIFVNSADQLILSTRISPAEFALYSIGCLSIAPLLIFEHAVTRVLIPQMSQAFSQKNVSHAGKLYFEAIENLAFMLIPAVAGLIIFAVPIIELCFTKRYSAAADYLQVYALSYLLLIIPYDALARAQGNSRWILQTFIIFSLISLSLAALFTQFWGPMGALSGILLSGLCLRVYALIYFQANTKQTFRFFIPFASLTQYGFVCAALGALAVSVHHSFSTDRTWFFVMGPVFALSYLLFALPLKNRSSRSRSTKRGVLVITQSLDIGGLERMVFHLCRHLQEENHWVVSVLAYDQNPGPHNLIPRFAAEGIVVESFKKRKGFSPTVVMRVLKSMWVNDVRLLHSHDLGGLIYAALAKLCCFGQVSIVHTQHSFIHLQRKARYKAYERLLTVFVDKLSVVSDDTRDVYLDMGFNRDKIYVIPNGVDFGAQEMHAHEHRVNARRSLLEDLAAAIPNELRQHDADYWILYLARFFPGKGQEHALELWNRLEPGLRSRSVLCFVGPESQAGEYDAFRPLMQSAKDAERVFMLGPTDDPQRWLHACDLYLSCSEFEGMPLGPLEAAGMGLPILLTDIPGHTFLEDHALLYPIGDYAEGARCLGQILRRLAEDDERYFQERWYASRLLREQFSIAKMARKYSALYADNYAPEHETFPVMQTSSAG